MKRIFERGGQSDEETKREGSKSRNGKKNGINNATKCGRIWGGRERLTKEWSFGFAGAIYTRIKHENKRNAAGQLLDATLLDQVQCMCIWEFTLLFNF